MKAGWHIKTIGDVCDVVNGGTPKTGVTEYWDGPHQWITPAEMGKRSTPYIQETARTLSDLGLKNSSATPLSAYSVILSSRAPIGHLVINTAPMSTNQGCKGLVPSKQIEYKFLYHYLSSIVDLLNDLGTGATFKELSGGKLKEVKIPVPPLPDQQRIVGILDEAFDGIATAKANAEKNLLNAHALFESHLNDVFTQRGEGWVEKTIKEITSHLGDGLHGTPNYTDDGEYYFVNGNNLDDGNIVFKESTKRVSVYEFEKYKKKLSDRTVLVSINGTLGNVAFYNNEKIILGKSACYFNILDSVDKHYIKYIISSPYFLEYAHREATGATIKNVSLKSMREFKVPLPPLAEQNTIVRKLDSLSKKTKRLESIYQQKRAALDALKKSLLDQAFTGQL
jgi:type I restriction enzyme, S subunit